MIKIRYMTYNIIFSITATLFTTAIISFILVFLGSSPDAFPIYRWLKTWKLVFILAYIISLFLPKLINRLISSIFKVIEK